MLADIGLKRLLRRGGREKASASRSHNMKRAIVSVSANEVVVMAAGAQKRKREFGVLNDQLGRGVFTSQAPTTQDDHPDDAPKANGTSAHALESVDR